MEYKFFTLNEIIDFHQELIAEYGGMNGIRDMNLLRSAIFMPQSGSFGRYFHEDIYEMAAAYLFHMIKNHPFVDGNKRIGFFTAMVFLEINGVEIFASEEECYQTVIAVANGDIGKHAIAEFFRKNALLK